eukprot:869580-Pleurochrysis_carterae.AAC.3
MPSEGSDGSACGRHLVNVARGGIVDEEQAHQCVAHTHTHAHAHTRALTCPRTRTLMLRSP